MFSFDKAYKGWPPERLARHIVYWGFWLTFYGVVNGSHYGHHYLEWFLFEVLTMTVKLPYTYFVAYYLFPKLLPQGRYLALGAYVLLFAFVGMLTLTALDEYFPYDMPGRSTAFWSSKTVYMFADLIYVASPVVVIKMIQQYLVQQRTYARLKEEKIGAELQMLKNQLQPHFLFNTLNNIYGMVLSGEKQAAGAILKLSDILSYMLYEGSADRVDLDKEVSMLRNYIELEKIRYGPRLDLSFDQQGHTKGKMIPPLLLIPFVENAFKHGVSKEVRHAWVRVHLQADTHALVFLVENSLPLDGEAQHTIKSGIGLQNVRKRLQLLYPDHHQLSVSKNDSFLIKLSIAL